MAELGRLERVDLRQVWEKEDLHFTPWLAQEENLQLLGEAINLQLELVGREQTVGSFRADILCRDDADHLVLIENQLERTDHTHLGQLLTYAAGLAAVSIVWIAPTFAEEHRAALDWLNQHTDDAINAFGLEVELWRIGDSALAPKFNIVSQPNDWARSVHQAVSAGGRVSDLQMFQLRYWTAFKQHMEVQQSPLRCQKPAPQHWMTHSIGRAGFSLAANVSSRNSETREAQSEVRADFILSGPDAKSQFATLLGQRETIESQLGFKLTWHNPERANGCRLWIRRTADYQNTALWPEQHEWLRRHLEQMHTVLAPIIKAL